MEVRNKISTSWKTVSQIYRAIVRLETKPRTVLKLEWTWLFKNILNFEYELKSSWQYGHKCEHLHFCCCLFHPYKDHSFLIYCYNPGQSKAELLSWSSIYPPLPPPHVYLYNSEPLKLFNTMSIVLYNAVRRCTRSLETESEKVKRSTESEKVKIDQQSRKKSTDQQSRKKSKDQQSWKK